MASLQQRDMFQQFHLVLMLTHACNLPCTYCYNGHASSGNMSLDLARRSIDRAVASLDRGGTLELAFFGGEPLLRPDRLNALIDYARTRTDRQCDCFGRLFIVSIIAHRLRLIPYHAGRIRSSCLQLPRLACV